MPTTGRLNVVIGADTAPMTAGLNKAMAGLRSFLTLGAFVGAAKAAIAYGSAINDMAAKTQVGVKWLQATAYAAKLAGSSMEELGNSLVELRRAQAQALGGSAADQASFAALKISLQELKALGPEQLFDRVAEAVQRSNGGIVETNAALQVLGRGGKGLLAGMVQGFSEARMEAERLGLVLSGETIAAMDQLGDRLDTLKLGFTALTAEVLKNMMSLNNWSHLAQMGKAFLEIMNFGGTLKSLLGGPGDFARRLAELQAKLSGIVDSYAAEESEGGAPSRKQGSSAGDAVLKGKASKGAANDLARIGGYLNGGGVGNPLLRVQNQALQKLTAMHAVLERIASRQPGESITW